MKNNKSLKELQAQAQYMRIYIEGLLQQYWQLCEQIADSYTMGGDINVGGGFPTSRKEISSSHAHDKDKK